MCLLFYLYLKNTLKSGEDIHKLIYADLTILPQTQSANPIPAL